MGYKMPTRAQIAHSIEEELYRLRPDLEFADAAEIVLSQTNALCPGYEMKFFKPKETQQMTKTRPIGDQFQDEKTEQWLEVVESDGKCEGCYYSTNCNPSSTKIAGDCGKVFRPDGAHVQFKPITKQQVRKESMTNEKTQAYIIYIKDKKQSRRVQEALFAAGGSWQCGKAIVEFTSYRFMFIKNKRISADMIDLYARSVKEINSNELKFIDPEDVIEDPYILDGFERLEPETMIDVDGVPLSMSTLKALAVEKFGDKAWKDLVEKGE
jgi:hypothetical protein